MASRVELSRTDKGHFQFVLKAASSEAILTSELYQSKRAAQNGITSVQKNSPLEERFERKTATNGKSYFNLKAANQQIIGTGQDHRYGPDVRLRTVARG